MKLRCKHRPHFSKRELGFLFGLGVAMAILFVNGDDAISSVLKMPKPLPDIVKSYKSINSPPPIRNALEDSGVKINKGDYVTILAKGIIGGYGPETILLYQLGKKDSVRHYGGPELIEVPENGSIYLGCLNLRKGLVDASLTREQSATFDVDIIIWKRNDPKLIAKFLEEASSAQPKDKDLKEIAQEFRKRQEVSLALQKKSEGVGEVKKEEIKAGEVEPIITPPMKEQLPEAKKPETKEQIPEQKVAKRVEEKPLLAPRDKEIDKGKGTTTEKQVSTVVQKPREEKKTVTPLKEKEASQITEGDEGKKVEDLSGTLKKALQAMKELEEMKEVLPRLESMEVEKSRQPKNLPVIAIGYPKDGTSVDSEYVSLFGVAEHEKGISKFEILLNDKPIVSKDQRNVQLVPKGQKRIEFSEKVHLREGQNKIVILAQSEDGLTNQKILSVHLAKKREEVYGVVIGINKYKNLPSLKYAVNDAREFYRYLVEVNQVPKDHIWLLLDEDATLEKLKSTLGTLLRQSAGKDDTVIIFLAGHGATDQDPNSPDGDGLEKYILPYNADPKDLYATAMPMSEIARIFQRINSERLVFISDTCYSGASGGRTILAGRARANVSGAFLERISQGKGRVILTASDANELSVEKDELKHGVFTYYLLEGLRGKADLDGDGVITVDEIYRYVSMKVPMATGQNQHPVKKGETIGQIVLGVVK